MVFTSGHDLDQIQIGWVHGDLVHLQLIGTGRYEVENFPAGPGDWYSCTIPEDPRVLD